MRIGAEVIGRESELARVGSFLASGSGTLLIEGEAGAGKTTLWQAGLARSGANVTVLSCRPVEAEATLSFAGLGDLLGGVLSGVLDELPVPQRRALEAALLLEDVGRFDHHAVGAGTLSTLRALSRERPVVIAVDDVQWLDHPSARALAFALRRANDDPVRLLASMRSPLDSRSSASAAILLDHAPIERVSVGPLSVGAVERLLSDRLSITLPRTVLLRVHETSRGNPLFALELGRALVEEGALPGPGQPLPVPHDLHALLLERLKRLPADVEEALLLAALLPQPTGETLARAFGPGWERALERGRRAGIVDMTGDAVRFSHPLLASALATSVSDRQRRAAHARLAHAIDDVEQRARHLALAAAEPDEEVALALEEASSQARRRGAPDASAELAELARSLTPAGRPNDVWRRCIAAGDARFAAGDSALAQELFAQAASTAAAGEQRALALWHSARTHYHHDDVMGAKSLLDEALLEAGDDLALRAIIEHDLVYTAFAAGDLRATRQHGQAAAELAEQAGIVHILADALCHVGVAEFLLGEGVRWDLLDRALELEDWDEPRPVALRPSSVVAHILSWLGRIDESRAMLLHVEQEMLDRGDEGGLPWIWYRLAELDCWSGDWERGYERATAADRIAIQTGQGALRPPTCYVVALLAAHLGRVDEARAAATQGVAAATAARLPIGIGANVSVLGFLELSLGHADQAHALFAPLVAALRAAGHEETTPLFWMIDAAEALVAIGEHEQADSLLAWLERRANALDNGEALATAARGRALLDAARGDSSTALQRCEDALRHHERGYVPFQRGRTLLAKGQIARRARKWGVARAALTDALTVFDGLGARLWAGRARDELARIGGRPVSPLDLSDGERQVAELVVAGRTNREVAEVLFMSPSTVSATLARIYRKLGVASRAELAARHNRQSVSD